MKRNRKSVLNDPSKNLSVLTNLFKQLRLVWLLFRDGRVPFLTKLVLPLSLLYLVSPIDILPDFIVGLGQLNGPVAAYDLGEGETGACIQDGGADADLLEKQFPALSPDVGESALRREVTIRVVQMIDRRKRTSAARIRETFPDISLRHVLPDRRDVFHYVSIAVDDLLLRRCTHLVPSLLP